MVTQRQSAISFLEQEEKEGILSYKLEETKCKGGVAFKCTVRLSGDDVVFEGIGKADNTISAMEKAAREALDLLNLFESTTFLVLLIGIPGEA